MIDNKIYKVNLVAFGPDSNAYCDCTMKENIAKNDSLVVVKELFVKRTISKKYMKEVVTNKIIPVMYNDLSSGETYIPNSACFLKVSYIGKDLYEQNVLVSELRKYIANCYLDDRFSSSLSNLNKLFEMADYYYQLALSKNIYSNQYNKVYKKN